ncbi:MAG: LysR family transcriptional regulator [Polyangiaceae bacterium]|nr:LysR family transcriptional regulator [Polyangiaceae bacterium]
MNLDTFDWNLLVVLHTVLETRSATAAATRLNVTQSAISNALSRLRDAFGDPLVVRSGRGLSPTPRALELAPKLAEIVSTVRATFGSEGFDPKTTTRVFVIAMGDADQASGITRVVDELGKRMPRAGLRVVSIDTLLATDGLATGEVDAAISPPSPDSAGLYATALYVDEGVLVLRKGHPFLKLDPRKMAGEVASLRHIDIHLALGRKGLGHRIAEEHMRSHGFVRDIVVTVPTFAAAAILASSSDLAVGLPRRLAETLCPRLDLTIVDTPFPPVRFPLQLQWHERTHRDEGSRAFRDAVIAALGDTQPKTRDGRQERQGQKRKKRV